LSFYRRIILELLFSYACRVVCVDHSLDGEPVFGTQKRLFWFWFLTATANNNRRAGCASLKVVTVLEELKGDEATHELSAEKNESLTVLQRNAVLRDGRAAYWAINRRGAFGLVPESGVRVAGSGTFCVALEDYAGGANKIAFAKDERIEIVERVSAEWWHGVNARADEGRFPSALVDASDALPPPTAADAGKGSLQLSAHLYAGRSKWDGLVTLRSFETCRDAIALALRSACVSDDRIDKVPLLSLAALLSRSHTLSLARCRAFRLS
jgi:hypothetical protein